MFEDNAETQLRTHVRRIAIQGEPGSNSHMAALEVARGGGYEAEVVPCAVSALVLERLAEGSVDLAVLPIENSLHGSVAEHYDLLLQQPVRIIGESLLRIRFHLIATPGVEMSDLQRVLSHPVALAQCRKFLAAHPHLEVLPFYDTAGSVKHLMELQLFDTAGIAPELAAQQYGGEILQRDLEDHSANFTRFHTVCRADATSFNPIPEQQPDKLTLAFSIPHRPGSLVKALQLLSDADVNLTRIESRPVPGSPWEYVFYVEFRFSEVEQAERAIKALTGHCQMVKELGRYRAA